MVSSITNLGANAARRYIEINSAKANRSTEELSSGLVASNPSYDPSSAAVGYRLLSNIESLLQAGRNVSQATSMIQMATGFLGATNDVLTRMKRITVAANTDTIGDSERKMLNEEYKTLLDQIEKNAQNARWGGVSLFTGGGGIATANATQITAATITGGLAGAGTYLDASGGFVTASSTGLIDGTATDTKVTKTGANFNISVTVGNQTFQGTTTGDVGTILLTSTTDSGNTIAFNIATSAAAASAAQLQDDFHASLGLGTGTPATFKSVHTNAGSMPNVTLTAGGATNAGTWALTYTTNGASEGIFKITRGSEHYTVVAKNPTATMSETISFSNGISLALATFDGTVDSPQYLYDVTQGTAVTQNFQYAEKSTDILTVTFKGANVTALGLLGSNVLTTVDATSASTAIDIAQQALNEQIGDLGGKASQFKFMTDTLRINIQNSQAAKATFTDADVAQSMQDLQTYNGLQQISQTVFGKALNDLANLVQLIQSVR